MTRSTMLALTVAGFCFAQSGGAKAEVYYPWCVWYDAYTYNCGFVSLRQCDATALGAGGICRPNVRTPYGAYAEPHAPRRTKKKPRRH